MDEGYEVVAAILAAEATRQKAAQHSGNCLPGGHEIEKTILDYYWYFLNAVTNEHPKG